jgi:hypothetical protein
MGREWPEGTVVYYAASNSDAQLVRYFNPQTEWRVLTGQPALGAWLETTAVDRLAATPQGAQWLREHTQADSVRELNTGAHRIRFVRVGR